MVYTVREKLLCSWLTKTTMPNKHLKILIIIMKSWLHQLTDVLGRFLNFAQNCLTFSYPLELHLGTEIFQSDLCKIQSAPSVRPEKKILFAE